MKKIIVENEEVALFIPNISTEERINFFTDPEDQLQIAAFKMSEGEKIQPHLHLENKRELTTTAEVLFVQEGVLNVLFYADKDKEIIDQVISMKTGDLILLKSGIHGFEIGKDCKFIEIKQGPFKETADKVKLY